MSTAERTITIVDEKTGAETRVPSASLLGPSQIINLAEALSAEKTQAKAAETLPRSRDKKPRRLTGEAKLLRDAQAQLTKAQEAEHVAAKAYAVATAAVARCRRLIDALAIDTEQGQAHAEVE